MGFGRSDCWLEAGKRLSRPDGRRRCAARGGFCLEQALLPLSRLDYKPDAILFFSGHNEFHARYGWSRNVAHYVEEGPESLLGLQELARSITSTTHVIFKNLDRFYGEAPPAAARQP